MNPPRVGIVAGAVAVLLAPALLIASPASAAPEVPTIRLVPGGLLYTATDASAHNTVLSATTTTVTVTEYGPTPFSRQVPRGCTVADVPDGGVAATCPLPGRTKLTLRYGPGDDFVDGQPLPQRVSIDGSVGEGDNVALGSYGNDVWTGGSGIDVLYGGEGADVIRAGDGPNFIHGNSGTDFITSGNDLDNIFADASDDVIFAGDGLNFVYRGGGNDVLTGGDKGGEFVGDFLSGGSGNDLLLGLGDDDELNGGSGVDKAFGGSGDDLIRIRDGGTADTASCGTGQDIVRVDPGTTDRVDGSCETVVRSDPAVIDPEDEYDIEDESVEEAIDAVDVHAGYPKGWHRAFWRFALDRLHRR